MRNNQDVVFGGHKTINTPAKRNSQHTIFGENEIPPLRDEELDVNEDQGDYSGDPNGQSKSYLSKSFPGSPRHLRGLAQNALTVVSQLGRPTLFITVTCNTHWPEIQSRLFKGQTAFDRPDVVVQVFKARLSALIHNLKHGKYFGRRICSFMMYVIEWQNRGLPHRY